uniref:CPG4 domain-containing protein n=1 Tax=Caenorhabditis japonica TaxID=281687 RepID=A0A8R1DNU3_CAEJA
MSPIYLLLLIFATTPTACQNILPDSKNSLETTNAYLRSFLPWWPQNDAFAMRAAPDTEEEEVEVVNNATKIAEKKVEKGKNSTFIENVVKNGTKTASLALDDLKVHDIPFSPLDELSPASVPPKALADNHDGNFIINFDEMSECPRDCSKDLQEALGLVFQDMSHVERYAKICQKYNNASVCVVEDARCNTDDREIFEMMTSGLHYMCVEQELAFNATIKCIDDEAGLVQSECENQCQTKNLFMNWIMKSAMKDTIQQGVNGIVGVATGTNSNPLAFLQPPTAAETQTGWADMLGNMGKPPTPESTQENFENFRQFTNDLCRVGDCMLDCIRSKFNTRCEGSAGTLLSEVLVRPIAISQNKMTMLRPVLGMFVPEQCAYLHSNSDLKKHRIDTTMDEELKRMYSEKAASEVRERMEQDELLSNLVPLDKSGVPLPRALPGLDPINSPLDISERSLDQLILEMYSRNESTALNNVTEAFSKAPELSSGISEAAIEVNEASGAAESSGEVYTLPKTATEVPEVSSSLLDAPNEVNEASGTTEASGEGRPESSFRTSEAVVEASGEASGMESSGDVRTLLEASGEASGETSGDDVM